jgi:hypothetical protein
VNKGLKLQTAALLTAASILVTACGGGGGGGGNNTTQQPPPPPPPTNNLTAKAVVVETANPLIGFPMDLSVSLQAVEETDDVSVSIFAVEKNEDPNAEVRQIPLGSETIAKVAAGASDHQIQINIPSSVELPGAYFITAIVDPVDGLAETEEDDNSAAVEVNLDVEVIPNIMLTEVTLDRAALLINTDDYEEQVTGTEDNVYNADAGGTITVGADGLDPEETIDIEAFATLRLMRSDLGTEHDVPLYLWHSAVGRYINAYGIDPETGMDLSEAEWLPLGEFLPQLVEGVADDVTLNDIDRDSAHLNFYFPGKLGSEMEKAMRYSVPPTGTGFFDVPIPTLPTAPPPDLTQQAINELRAFLKSLPTNGVLGDETEAMAVMDFAVCVQIRPTDNAFTDLTADDNEVCAPLDIALPPLPPPVPGLPAGVPTAFKPFIGATATPVTPVPNVNGFKTSGGGSAFKFGIDFGSSVSADNRGYIEQIHGDVPITVFGIKGSFFKASVRAQLVPEYANKPAGEESSFVIETQHAGQILSRIVKVPSNVEIAIDLFSVSKEFPNPAKEFTLFVGPIPLSVGASVAGNFGVEYQPLVFTTEYPDGYALGLQGGPYANIEATLYAGVGKGPFIAGVEGVLSLLDERIVFFNGVDIAVIEHTNPSYPEEFVIYQGPKITNIFTGPQGKLNLFAKYSVPTIKTCKAGPFKFPCPGFKSIKATKNIWKSKALFQLTDVLYEDDDAKLDVVIADGEPPAYYVLP